MIREATPKDFSGVAKLVKNRQELLYIYPSGKFPLTPAQIKELYEARRDFTVLTQKDKIIGFANLYDYLENRFVFVGNVVIDEAYRGCGKGKKLISHMINLAEKKYLLPEVRISVFADNADALYLYLDFGFEIYAKEIRNYQNRDLLLLHLRIIFKTTSSPCSFTFVT